MAKNVRRPKKVKIGDKTYKVVSRTKKWGKKEKAYGMIDYDAALIKIAKDPEPKGDYSKIFEDVDTLVHEVYHGIKQELGLKLDGRKEEKFVKNLSTGWCQVMLNNPQLLEWVYQKIKKEKEAQESA